MEAVLCSIFQVIFLFIKRWQVRKDCHVGLFVPAARELMSEKSERTQQRIDFLNAVRNCQAQELERVLKTTWH